MHPKQPQRKPPNKIALIVLGSIAVVLALCLGVGIVGALVTGGDDTPETSDAGSSIDTGIPPTPSAEDQAAYIAALNAIDPAIVGDKDEARIVGRGRDQCSSVRESPDDQAKLIDLTNRRFTAPDHPDGFGPEKAAQILAVVRQYICPTY